MNKEKSVVVYVHGKGGNAGGAEHYKPFFSNSDVVGFDYRAETPGRAADEFRRYFAKLFAKYTSVSVIANSIGAYFIMTSVADLPIRQAWFVSPIVNMEILIYELMAGANITEQELQEKQEINIPFGVVLGWKDLEYVRAHPVKWRVPTHILYGEHDNLTGYETLCRFVKDANCEITVMPGGEHWFHTDEQMNFLDNWLKNSINIIKA